MKILFLSFTCEDIGVTMATNMISQLQENFPLRRPVLLKFHSQNGFEVRLGTVTGDFLDELPNYIRVS